MNQQTPSEHIFPNTFPIENQITIFLEFQMHGVNMHQYNRLKDIWFHIFMVCLLQRTKYMPQNGRGTNIVNMQKWNIDSAYTK